MLASLLLTMLSMTSIAQMIYWTTPPYKLNMSTATPTSSALPGAGGAYSVANGTYDQNGNLLFYVRDYGIYGPTGTYIGELATTNAEICDEEYSILSSEIAIVPIPGTCKQYYVIYSMDNPGGISPVLYVKVNCSGGSPVITYNGNVWVSCPNFTGYKNQAFVISGGHGGLDHTSIAVSKVYTGSGSAAKRFLFSVSDGIIVRSDITNTGITAGTTVVSAATLGLGTSDFVSFEAELSWSSNYFAWSNINGKVHVIQVPNGIYTSGSLQNYNVTAVRGIEFNNANTTPKLYASGSAGMTQILTSNQTTSIVSTPGFNLTNTYLEYGKNNKIYGISPTYSGSTLTATTFVGINPSNNSISSFNPGLVDSRFTQGYLGQYACFTLPIQIDGENYSYFNGQPAVTITNFTLNGSVPGGDCDMGGYSNYCQNNAINFNATYAGGAPAQYKFDIQAFNIGTCNVTTGAGLINYHSNWTNGTPPANLDLRTLSDGAGINLGNSLSGLVRVIYSIQDVCGYISTYTRVINIYIPVPPVVALEIYNKNNPQVYLAPSQNIASPISIGTASLGYRINNSTGTITSLRVLIQRVDNTGAVIAPGTIYDRTTTVNGVSNLTYENLNNYCVNANVWGFNPGFGNCNVGYSGYTGYFSYTNGQLSYLNYYKLTVTVGNLCGSSTNWSYLYVNSIGNRMANPGSSESAKKEVTLSVFPNPATDNLTVRMNNPTDDYYQMEIIDALGRQVMILMPETKIEKGVFEKTYDISALPNGIYTYRIKSDSIYQSGILSKN